MVTAQRLDLVLLPVHDIRDLGQPQPDLAEQQDPLQPQQLLVLVVPVPVGRDVRRNQQPDLVVIAQRAGCNPRHAGHLPDRPPHYRINPRRNRGSDPPRHARSCRYGKVKPHPANGAVQQDCPVAGSHTAAGPQR